MRSVFLVHLVVEPKKRNAQTDAPLTFVIKTLKLYQFSVYRLLGEPKKTERTKFFELSKFQIFVNKRFEAAVNHSNMVHFLEAKMLSHIESENEMTGIDV